MLTESQWRYAESQNDADNYRSLAEMPWFNEEFVDRDAAHDAMELQQQEEQDRMIRYDTYELHNVSLEEHFDTHHHLPEPIPYWKKLTDNLTTLLSE